MNHRAYSWAVSLASLIFIVMMVLHWIKDIEMTSATVVFTALLIGWEMEHFLKNSQEKNVKTALCHGVIVIGLGILFITTSYDWWIG